MSDTPQTDARDGEHSKFLGVAMVSADFARSLERERNLYYEALFCVIQCEPQSAQANIARGFITKAKALNAGSESAINGEVEP